MFIEQIFYRWIIKSPVGAHYKCALYRCGTWAIHELYGFLKSYDSTLEKSEFSWLPGVTWKTVLLKQIQWWTLVPCSSSSPFRSGKLGLSFPVRGKRTPSSFHGNVPREPNLSCCLCQAPLLGWSLREVQGSPLTPPELEQFDVGSFLCRKACIFGFCLI